MNALLRDVRSADWPASSDVVVLFLHGYGSNERDLTGLAPALGLTLPWASLRAPLEMSNGGAAWFEVQVPGHPDPAALTRATQRAWDWVDAHVGEAALVVPIGFSQGGLMATQLLRTRPDRVVAPVVLGGFVGAESQVGDEILAVRRPSLFWGRGAEDRVIAAAAIERTSAFLPGHSTLVEQVYAGLGHGMSSSEVDDVREFLAQHAKPRSEER